MKHNAVFGAPEDVDSWMALVELSRDSFPGLEAAEAMASHRATVEKCIARGSALCVREGGAVIGVLLFSPRLHQLSCMAVHPEYRGRGIGSVLVSRMLELVPGTVSVRTFREGDPLGVAARAMYAKFGFEPGELTEDNGHPGQRHILTRP